MHLLETSKTVTLQNAEGIVPEIELAPILGRDTQG